MKKIIILLAVITLAMTVSANNHPSLFFTKERVEAAKRRLKNDTLMQSSWQYLEQQARQKVEKANINDAELLSLAYVMTDEQQFADTLKVILMGIAKTTKSFSSDEMLQRKPVWRADLGLASKAYKCAVAYDVIRQVLNSKDRKTIAEGLNRNFVVPSLEDWVLPDTRIHTINSMGHNWWTSCAGMGAILALALEDDIPSCKKGAKEFFEQLPDWFNFEGDEMQNKQSNFDPIGGGFYESFGYASFGITEALKCLMAYKNAHGNAVPQSIDKHLQLLTQHFIETSYPRSSDYMMSLNFGDGHPNCTAQEPLMMLWALGYHDSNILWYMSKLRYNQHRDCLLTRSPLGFLYMPDYSQHPSNPSGLELQHLWPTFGWATMRSSWNDDATMLAVKSGHTWNHSHADASSFILYHKGVDIICDAGNCNYPNAPYREYFFQSQAHNVVLFNGEAQPRLHQYQGSMIDGSLHNMIINKDFKYIMADATGPTSKNFARNFRHFLWIDNVLLIIDDIEAYEYGEFEWLIHPRGEAKNVNGSLQITNGESQVLVTPLFPQLLVPSGFVHDYPDYLYIKEYEAPDEYLKETVKYYGFCAPQKLQRAKGITAITIKDTISQSDLPKIERRQGVDWIGVRITYKGKVTDVYLNNLADGTLMHRNSWIEVDKWNTDAYMMAVTYNAGTDPSNFNSMEQADRFFVCYGSTLRNASGKTLFSSQIKKTFLK